MHSKNTLKKNLHHFMKHEPGTTHGYLICRCERLAKVSENITALPWREVGEVFK